MRILFLTQIVPYPPDSGPKVKTYHVLRYLATQGHQVTLATFVRDAEQENLDGLRTICEAIHSIPMRRSRVADVRHYVRSLRSRLPFLVTRDDLPSMHQLISRLMREQKFDIVHADQLTMGQFALPVCAVRRVLDAHNAVWTIIARAQQTAPPWVRLLLAYEAHQLKAYEGALCRQMDAVLAVSDIDRSSLIEAGAPPDNIHVIPIAVDCDALPMVRPPQSMVGHLEILTVSTLYYPPNADGVRWFIREVYPLITAQVPNVKLTIVGPRPPKDIVEFGARNKRVVTVTGYVPDLQPFVERATLMVVPVRAASGMRVRILEALARGIPVVTTKTGAEGIDGINGEHLLLSDEPADFAKSVILLLQNPDLRQRLAENGRCLVERKYDWKVVMPLLDAAYRAKGN